MAEIKAVHSAVSMSIDTSETPHTMPTWTPLCAGWDNIAEALNEVTQQYFFLCGKGFATNAVTGMAPAFTLSGVRVVGDAAQEWLFAADRKYGTGEARQSKLKMVRAIGEEPAEALVVPITITNLVEFSGGATDGSAISMEIRFDGAPAPEAA